MFEQSQPTFDYPIQRPDDRESNARIADVEVSGEHANQQPQKSPPKGMREPVKVRGVNGAGHV